MSRCNTQRYKCLTCQNANIYDLSLHKCSCPCTNCDSILLPVHQKFLIIENLTNTSGFILCRGNRIQCPILAKDIIHLYLIRLGIINISNQEFNLLQERSHIIPMNIENVMTANNWKDARAHILFYLKK